MSVFSHRFGNVAKKVTAWSLAALTAVTCVGTLPSVINNEAQAASGVLSNSDRGVLYASTRTDFRDETIYFLLTTRFYDGDPSNNEHCVDDTKAKNPDSDPAWRGDFKGLIDKLDYIKALGFTAIWITPVVQNRSSYDYHGYHAYDFTAVDYRYESNGVTYQDLIDACHAKGMKVIQDVVFNHSCNWGEKNLCPIEIDVWSPNGRSDMPMPNERGIAMDPNKIYHHAGYAGGGDFDNFNVQPMALHSDCFDLNTENPTVYNYLIDCYKKFIDMGVDAFRVDTVKHISRLTLNKTFVPALQEEYKKVHTGSGYDDFYMFGEVCTKGESTWYRDQPPISTCFYTWKDDDTWLSKWSTDPDANLALTEEHYNAHCDTSNQPTSTNAFLNGNDYHTPDYSQRSGLDSIDFQMHWQFDSAGAAFGMAKAEDPYFNDSTWSVTYVNSHDYSPNNRQTIIPDFDANTWAEDLNLIFTFRGIPCIYYGTEIQFQAGKIIDKGPELPLSETGRAYFGDKIEGEINTGDFTVYNATGAAKTTLESPLSQHLIRLNRIRQAVPALRKGQYSVEGVDGGLAFKRRYTDANTDSFACVTISGDATFTGIPDGTYVDAVTGDTKTVTGGTLSISCSGQGNLRVYVLNTAKTPAPGRVVPNGNFMTDGGAASVIGGESVDPIDIVEETGVTVSPATVTVKQAETASVTATVAPANATYKNVTWSSSDESVATVSGGTIKGISVGTATITAKTKHGKTATVKVTVVKNDSIVDPTGVSISPASLTLSVGESGALTGTVTPSNATDKSVTWSSDNTGVATVDASGNVKAVAAGTATITATTSNGKKATAKITVEGKSFTYVDHGVYFEKPSGWGSTINAYIYDGATDSPAGVGPEWPGAAMKDCGNGVYSLEKTTDKTTLKVIFNDGSNQAPGSPQPGFEYKDCGYYTSDGFKEIVKKPETVEVTSVSVSPTSATVNVGETTTLSATAAPSNATNKTITWKSSNTSVATVSNGVVTGVAEGTATITASSANGKSATATVTVNKPAVVSDLANTSKISATSITLGSSATVTCSSTGGTGTKQYYVGIKKSDASSFTDLQQYSTNTTCTVKPTTAGTYTVRVTAKDGSGKLSRKEFTLTVKVPAAALSNTSKISATTITLGNSATVTCSATGGTGTKQYYVGLKKSTASSFTDLQPYSTSTSCVVKPTAVGTYTVRVTVKDGSGNLSRKEFTLTVNAAPVALSNTSKISATTLTLGNSATVTCSSTGGTGTKQYYVGIKKSDASAFTDLQPYSTSTSCVVKPSAAGTYTVRVTVKDGSGKLSRKEFTLTVNKPVAELANTSTISATSVLVGNGVKITGASTGGTGTKYYGVWYKKSTASTWTMAQDYETNNVVTVYPKYVGTYNIQVKVRDGKGTEKTKNFTVTTTNNLANTSTVSATTISKGNTVTVKAASTGGTGTKKYAVWYKKSTQTEWTKARDFATGTTISVKPNFTGTYTISVKVKDGSGTVVRKTFTIKVNAALANTSKVSASTITKGNSVTVTASSTGGVGTKKYAVWYKKSTATTWNLARGFATGTTIKVTPNYIGTYTISVKVKDGAGTVVRKLLTVKVNAALANTSKISSTSITKGSSVTLTCASTGGIGTKTYAVWYKPTSSTTWTLARDHATGTSVKVTPKSATTYTVRVKAKDGKGTIKNKDFTVKVTAALTNTSKLSATSINLGSAVTVTCAATGGTGTKSYAVYYRQSSQSSWTKARDYATGTSVKVTPKSATNYVIRVKAKDAAGKIVNKDLTVKVVNSNALTNTSTIATTTVSSGAKVKVTCSATKGSAPYYYKVERMKSGGSTWTTVRDYDTAAVVYVQIPSAAKYQIKVTVSDMEGKTAVKYFTVTGT